MTANDLVDRSCWWQRREPNVAWIAPVVFLQFFCYTGSTSFLQAALNEQYGKFAVALYAFAMGMRGFTSFFITPCIGALADQFGRRTLLGLQMLIGVLYAIPLAVMPENTLRTDLALVLVALMGMAGGQFVLSFAYCADLAPLGEQSAVQALIARMLSISFSPAFIIAPTAWKYLFHWFGDRLAWTLVASLGLMNALYVWTVMPESRKRRPHIETNDKTPCRGEGPPQLSKNPLVYFRFLSSNGPASAASAHYLRLISGIIFFLYIAKMTVICTITIFVEQRFGWSPGDAGLLLSAWGASQFLSMAVVGKIGKRVDERIISWVGLLSALIGMLIFFFALEGWLLFLGMAIGAVSMISLTALTSYGCCLVRTSMSGEVNGLMTTMICLTEMVGPPMFGTLISAVLGRDEPWYIVNMPFGIGAVCVIISMALMSRLPSLPEALSKCGRTLDQSIIQFFPGES